MPVIVSVCVPAVAVGDAVTVSVEVLPVVLVGLSDAVTPFAAPVTASATLPANPPVRVMLIVLVPLAPWFTDNVAGVADSV